MGEPGSPRLRGVASPGEESLSRCHCGTGDRGTAVLWPDQAIEAAWLAGPAALKEKTWRISSDKHKRQGSPGEERETRACRSAGNSRPGPGSGAAPMRIVPRAVRNPLVNT